jgi:membrane protease YdiL (CAAX protease family)
MFRGVLYRHVRDAALLRGLGLGAGVLASSTLVAFLFAAIHPQGWVAVPALMSLAYGMTLVREWRGTLVPSMVLHGLSNGLVMLLLILLLGN